ncbi:hypothetical protein BGZ98_008371 [Dissophora globulifera]|nr:hypothetical protein BGZ98_008371 [Dissophora globulifera]
MSVRLVSSAKNLREQFKSPSNSASSNSSPMTSSGSSVYTASSGISRSKTLEPTTSSASLSRQGSFMHSSSGGLLRAKSMQKKGLMSKVFADEAVDPHDALPDLSMEVTLLIVKRCAKEIRERGLATKGILRQVQMGQSQRVVIDTIRMILDDDATTELSSLHQIDIHLVAHAMKWAIRYSEQILVTYEDYQALYINQAHLNNMTLVSVAKAISLSIMAGPEREFTTFDASLQQRNLWGAACEDLLRAFLRIKTSYDLAKIDQEDEVDENRYICNETRVLKSARQQSNEIGRIPNSINLPTRPDFSAPTSANSSQPGSDGWPTPVGPMATTPYTNGNSNGYFDTAVSQATSPLAQSGGTFGASLSRSQSMAKPVTVIPRVVSPSPYNVEDIVEYEELMQDQSHLHKLRQDRNSFLRPAEPIRRRSSVADMDSLYMLPMETAASTDGYESDPEVSHAHDDDDDDSVEGALIPDFADGLHWDFSKKVNMRSDEMPSLASFQSQANSGEKYGVNRSNSSSSNASGLGDNGPPFAASPRSIRDLSKQQLTSMRLRQLQEQHQADYPSPSFRAPLQQDLSMRDQTSLSPLGSPNRLASNGRPRANYAVGTSPSFVPRHSRRNSAMRRSISLDPVTMHGRIHMKPNELHADMMARELALQTEKELVAEDIRNRLLGVRNADHQEPSRASSAFSLQMSPQDLECPTVTPRRSLLSMKARPQSMLDLNFNVFQSMSTKAPMSALRPSQQSQSQQQPTSAKEVEPSTRTFEVVSRPKEIEVSVIFTPIPTSGPLSAKGELKSKFQESFPDRPISPPIGYSGPKRTLTGNSTKSTKLSSPTSPNGSQRQQLLHGSSNVRPPLLQQSMTFSGVSATSSLPSTSDGKSKTSGFIRALSHRLRSKQSDDQLRPSKINSQQSGLLSPTHASTQLSTSTTSTATAGAPAVSFEPPRLELSFMDDGLGPTELRSYPEPEDRLPPTSAPVLMHSRSLESNVLMGWRQEAQAALPIQLGFEGGAGAAGTGNTGYQQHRDLRPTGMPPLRRASTTAIESGSISKNREQLHFKEAFKMHDNVLSSPEGATRSLSQSKQQQLEPVQSFTPSEASVITPRESSESSNILKAGAEKEKEFCFSTATLLMDGKLYYQLQWDEFSELGFKSDLFTEPEQCPPGLSQIGLVPVHSRKQSSNAESTMAVATAAAMAQQQNGLMKASSSSTTNSSNPSLDLPGQLGQATAAVRRPNQGPSQAQRDAAMKVARESCLALANDPTALEALKRSSGHGQPTIINSGSFAAGSAQPQLDYFPRPPVITSKLISKPPQQQQPYPGPDPSLNASLRSARSLETVSMVGKGHVNVQRSMSDRSLPTSSSIEATAGSLGTNIKMQSGPVAIGGAGHGSSLSALPNKCVPETAAPALIKFKTGSRLFGKKNKASKKSSLSASLPSSVNGGRKRRLLPVGVKRQDVMTRTVESMDEVFPWMCIEHMAGQESGWVMLESVQDGAVGWVMIDKLEEDEDAMAQYGGPQLDLQPGLIDSTRTAMQAQVA